MENISVGMLFIKSSDSFKTTFRYAVGRLKEKLGVTNDGDDSLNNPSDKIKSTEMKELKSLLKQRLMQGVTGGLDAILER